MEMNELKEEKQFFNCACHGEGLLISKFEDDEDPNYKEVYLCMYSLGTYNKAPGFWNRLKYAWYHMKTGKKYEDQLILTYDEAKDMARYLLKITK